MLKSLHFEKKKDSAQKYPYLGKLTSDSSLLIVLFSAPRTGTVVQSNWTVWKLGDYDKTWMEWDFKEMIGTVTLENNDE